jgi:hypothetical protein
MQRVGYVGRTKSGKPHGHGKYTYASGDIYEGEWVAGNKSGYGVQTYLDTSLYEGNYFQDERDGLGTLRYCNGDEYVGHWKKGRAHGPGFFRNKSHGVVYHDVWSYGRSAKTGGVMTTMLNSSWKLMAASAAAELQAKKAAAGPASPCWRNPSTSPGMVKVARSKRPSTAPAARDGMRMTSLQRCRLMETVIMDSLGGDTADRGWGQGR